MSESTEQPFVSVPNVKLPDPPAPDAPPVHHANWLHSLFAAIEATANNPAIVAMLPPKYRAAVALIGVVGSVGEQIVADPNASPASLGAS